MAHTLTLKYSIISITTGHNTQDLDEITSGDLIFDYILDILVLTKRNK